MDGLPTGGFTLSKIGADDGANVTRRGRPESEIDTPVNIENGLYRDNGEGVAATPLPYPLIDRGLGGGIKMRPFFYGCPGRIRVSVESNPPL